MFELWHVVQKYVAVDVCQDNIEFSFQCINDIGVTVQDAYIRNAVNYAVVFSVLSAPFVNIVPGNIFAPSFADTIDNIPVPHPQSSTCSPLMSLSSSSLTIM